MKELSPLELAIASSLMAGAMQAAMIQSMVRNKALPTRRAKGFNEQALLMLETNQTASSSFKPAVLSNGVRTMVPPHVSSGTRIVVSTEDGSYVERAKD